MLHYDFRTIDLEISYIHYVRLIATAVNEMFKQEISTHISDLVTRGGVVSGDIKGYERMQNKLKSFADHWNSQIPRFPAIAFASTVLGLPLSDKTKNILLMQIG